MPISKRLKTKIRSTMLCLTGFELYSWRWVPLLKKEEINTMDNVPDKQADFLHPTLSRALFC